MPQRLLILGTLAMLFTGCGPREVTRDSAIVVTNSAPAGSGEADPAVTAILEQLTQTLRRFSAEKQRVPKSLQELVAAGYIPSVPSAPAGKKFEINERRVEVVLSDQ